MTRRKLSQTQLWGTEININLSSLKKYLLGNSVHFNQQTPWLATLLLPRKTSTVPTIGFLKNSQGMIVQFSWSRIDTNYLIQLKLSKKDDNSDSRLVRNFTMWVSVFNQVYDWWISWSLQQKTLAETKFFSYLFYNKVQRYGGTNGARSPSGWRCEPCLQKTLCD